MSKGSSGGSKGGGSGKSGGGNGGGGRPAPIPPGKAGWPTNNGTSNPSGGGRNNAPSKKG
ncbi:MAG: hypothetical protein Ta2B_16260 [Termitinemataceae bacterium]|nr:MAG: hypothetical protein Ta2B_16260 [Termitinemataceae bacterium]